MPNIDYYHVIWNAHRNKYEVQHASIVLCRAFWSTSEQKVNETEPRHPSIYVEENAREDVMMTPEGGIAGYAAATALIPAFPKYGPYHP